MKISKQLLRSAAAFFCYATAVGLLQAGTIYDAAGDYLAGWTAGTNPNGVWSYGWSTTAGGTINLYTANGTNVSGIPQFDSWSDPANFVSSTPVVYFNPGPAVNNGSLHDLPADALVLHGGGTAASCGVAFGCFSEVIWTAPSTGLFDLAATFTGRQFGVDGLVEIVDTNAGGESTLLSGLIADQRSQSLTEEISVDLGDTITFAALHQGSFDGDTTQLTATLTTVSPTNTPEPSTLALVMAGLGLIAWRRLIADPAR